MSIKVTYASNPELRAYFGGMSEAELWAELRKADQWDPSHDSDDNYDDDPRPQPQPQDDPRRPKTMRVMTIRQIVERFGVTTASVHQWLSGTADTRVPLRCTRVPAGRAHRVRVTEQDMFDWLWLYRRDLVDRNWGLLIHVTG